MDLVNNATTVGTGGQNLVLETAGHIYVKVNERYYELDFKNSGSDKLYGKPVVNEVVPPTEEIDLSDYITNDDLKKVLKKYITERSWQDVMDTQTALQNSLLDFEEAIKPITVQTMQVVVGSEELQFDWIYSFTQTKGPNGKSVDTPLYIDMDESSNHYGQLVWNPGFIKHYTIDGPNTVSPEVSPSGSIYTDDRLKDYWRWYIMNSEGNDEIEEIYMDETFYVYLKVPYSSNYSSNSTDLVGTGPYGANLYINENGAPSQMIGSGKYAKTGIGRVVYSTEAIKFGPEYDEITGLNYYYLLYAIVTNKDGSPSIATLNGFTEILPGQIRAYIFATADGSQYLDFLHERFKIGNNNEYLSWENGQLNIKGNLSVTGGELREELKGLLSQVGNDIECWFSDDGATHSYDLPLPNENNKNATPNWPVSTWNGNYAEHLGDFYYVVDDNPSTTDNEKGWAFRYIKNENQYYWARVSDNSISLELYNAYLAKKEAENAFNKLKEWASDGVISPLEVTDIETEYNFIINDYKEQSKKAEIFDLTRKKEWTAYNTAYNNYKNSLKEVLDWWEGIKNDPDKITETFNIPNSFKTNLENFYTTRAAFINLALTYSMPDVSYLTTAIKKGRTDVTGGLVLTSLIELGFSSVSPDNSNYYDYFTVMSGINGTVLKKDSNGNYDYTDPAVWFGGDMIDKESGTGSETSKNCSLYVSYGSNQYIYTNDNSTVTGTLYEWIRKSDETLYYSLNDDGSNEVCALNSSTPLRPKYSLNPSGSITPYTQMIQTHIMTVEFIDSSKNSRLMDGEIEAYRIKNTTSARKIVYNTESQGSETLVGTFDEYLVISYKANSSNTVSLKDPHIITFTPPNSTSISGFMVLINDVYNYIPYNNLTVTKEKGFVFTYRSIKHVYKYVKSESFNLNRWKSSNNGYLYTLDDYDVWPTDVFLYSDGVVSYSSAYSVYDHKVTETVSSPAKGMFRMDGSGYLANGNISWDKEGALKLGQKMTIDPEGVVDLGYLHVDQTSFWIGTKNNKMLEVTPTNCTINGSLRARAKDYYSGSFVSIEDSSGKAIADIGSTPLSTNSLSTYLRQTDDIGIFEAKGAIMYGTVTIPKDWEYILIPQYNCYTIGETYKITNFNFIYDIARVSKAITIEVVLRKNNGSTNRDIPVFTRTLNVSNNTYKYTITEADLDTSITTNGISLEILNSYSLVLKLRGQVKSGISSNSRIRINRGPCEAKITRSSKPLTQGTFIRPNGISSVFSENSKFQWLGSMVEINGGYSDHRSEGGTFIVSVPSTKESSDENKIIGLEITGYLDSSGTESNNTGIRINLGDGWYKLKIENGIVKAT